MPDEYHLRAELSTRQFVALGRITASWALLEWGASVALGRVLGLADEETRVLIHPMNLRPKLEALSLLVPDRLIKRSGIDEFNDQMKTLRHVQSIRRMTTHCVWAQDERDDWFMLKAYGGGGERNRIEFKPEPASDEDIERTADEIDAAMNGFFDWWDRAQSQLTPSPYRPF